MGYTTIPKIRMVAKNLEIGSGKAVTLTDTEAQAYIDWADDVINSKLSVTYYTPLRQITRGSDTYYPNPIEWIATNLAAGWMVEAVYARIESQISDAGKVHKDNALMELNEFCNGVLTGSRRLEGQTLKARNNFANPYVAPLEPPKV